MGCAKIHALFYTNSGLKYARLRHKSGGINVLLNDIRICKNFIQSTVNKRKSMEYWCNDTGNRKHWSTWKENLSECHFVHHKSHMDRHAVELGARPERLRTETLRQGTVGYFHGSYEATIHPQLSQVPDTFNTAYTVSMLWPQGSDHNLEFMATIIRTTGTQMSAWRTMTIADYSTVKTMLWVNIHTIAEKIAGNRRVIMADE
jgi:hypothetical protein